ncbi:MAG: hypothetical protein NTY22_09225, partial [Proteobacteria bacterium]|nr:hypothetical protein [Pseudomonadota bacterium]
MKELIQCIYCKETKPSSREHVLQKSLGGNLVEKFVCEDCNQSFSSIDQALTEFSLISLSRVVNQSTDSNVKLGGEHFIKSEDGYHYEVEMRGGLKPLYKPQLGLIFNDNQIEIKTIASSKEDILLLYKTLKQHIVNNTVDKIHIKNNPKNSDEKGFIPRLVLHRKKTL